MTKTEEDAKMDVDTEPQDVAASASDTETALVVAGEGPKMKRAS